MRRPVPQYICHPCGTRFCRNPVNPGATWHLSSCECCFAANVPCAEARDYGGFEQWPLPADIDPVPEPKTLADLVEPVISSFDFERVHKAMKAMGWKWDQIQSSNGSVPSIDQMKASARRLLVDVVSCKQHTIVACGGFCAEKSINNIDPLDDGLILRFILDESEWYFGDFQDE